MIPFTEQQREEHRKQRARLKVGDRVALVGQRNRVQTGTVKKVTPQRVSVAFAEHWITEYWIEDGRELVEFPSNWLRGLATPEELEALERPIAPKKNQGTLEALAMYLTREQLRVLWPQAMGENRLHLQDEPGIHLDEGNYANQLRYHDSKGVLRGRLLAFHEAKYREKQVDEWDCHGGTDEQPGHFAFEVDPERLRQGIGSALLKDAFITRNWPVDFDKQRYTLAGAACVRKFRKSLAWINHEASRQEISLIDLLLHTRLLDRLSRERVRD
jgi:GNAT superfamily N-acetyltransferase